MQKQNNWTKYIPTPKITFTVALLLVAFLLAGQYIRLKASNKGAIVVAKFEDNGLYLVVRIDNKYSVLPVNDNVYKHHNKYDTIKFE